MVALGALEVEGKGVVGVGFRADFSFSGWTGVDETLPPPNLRNAAAFAASRGERVSLVELSLSSELLSESESDSISDPGRTGAVGGRSDVSDLSGVCANVLD